MHDELTLIAQMLISIRDKMAEAANGLTVTLEEIDARLVALEGKAGAPKLVTLQ